MRRLLEPATHLQARGGSIPVGECFRASPLETRFAALLSQFAWCAHPEDDRIIWSKANFYGSSQVPMTIDGRRIVADFAFACRLGNASIVVVELDGHDFHERTHAQAMRDRTKDRAIQLRGHMVLRFTGHEVMSYGRRCVHELELGLRVVEKRLRDKIGGPA